MAGERGRVDMLRASVIIPTRGRPAALATALRSLLALDPAALDTEVLVVDNNSDPSLTAEVNAACIAAGAPVRYVAEPSPGQSAARNRGAREARGEVLAYIDDDVEVGADWLRALLAEFDRPDVGMVGGPSLPRFDDSVPAWFWDFLRPTPFGGWCCGWLSLLDIGRRIEDFDPFWIWGLNFSLRRRHVFELGGFHPDLVPAQLQRWQGDGETGLALNARSQALRAVYAPEVLLHHAVSADRLTLDYFCRRAYYQGVCDSFTQIRGGTPPAPMESGPKPVPPAGGPAGARWPEAAEVRGRTAQAYNDGWNFHQREAADDPRLLQWIRRADYWDADIRREMELPA